MSSVFHITGEYTPEGKYVGPGDWPYELSSEIAPPILKEAAKHRELIRIRNLELTKIKLQESVGPDQLIVQAFKASQDCERFANQLAKRLREWYALHTPEAERSIPDHEKLAELIASNHTDVARRDDSMGATLEAHDLDMMRGFANTVKGLFEQKTQNLDYIESIMKAHCPNLQALAGTAIAARLIEHTGSLKRLMLLPASTIQILGAEKALFRHLRSGARPPKYGYILQHPFVQNASRDQRGRHARMLADKLAIAARIDFFKGEFKADKLQQELEAKK